MKVKTLYIGVDFHPYQQTLSWCDTVTGETDTLTLKHDLEEVREFYRKLPPAIVGIEASSRAVWFEKLLAETKHQLLVGNPVLIRRRATSRHKSDRRDAELILRLLLDDEFPAIWRRPVANTQVLDILKLRHTLVKQRSQTYHRLSDLARSCGLPQGKIKTKLFQGRLQEAEVGETEAIERRQLLELVTSVSRRIDELEDWLKWRAEGDRQVQLLQTQAGVGYLTAIAFVNTIGQIGRFSRVAKQIPAYLGLDPLERESAGKRRAGSISRAGSALTRHLLGQSANICVRYDKKLKAFYKRLCRRKPKPVAMTATARKLSVKLAIMWRDQITATEFDRRGRTVSDARS